MARRQTNPVLVERGGTADGKKKRQNSSNLFDLAYARLEELIVNCTLRPGRYLSIQNLQDISGFSRTPIYQAVSRLAHDTLLVVRPRHGIQIAPIDLARERMLLQLRCDMERFVIRLACDRSGPTERNQMMHLTRALRERRESTTVDEFNAFDRRIDKLVLSAGKEPFLENTLRPLHTVFRRIGSFTSSTLPAKPACDAPSIAISPYSMPSPAGIPRRRSRHPMTS